MNEEDLLQQQRPTRSYTHCEFQRECWKTIRAPLARKHKIYLPYICSYQELGDLDKCAWRDSFIEKKKEKESLIIDGQL